MEPLSRNASFSDVFLPSTRPAGSPSFDFVRKKRNKVESLSSINSHYNCKISEENSSPSVSAESDSGLASSADESTSLKSRRFRRPPGCLDLDKLFEEVSLNPDSSKDYHLRMVKEIRIEDGSIGFGYDRLFSDGLNDRLSVVCIEDPYIFSEAQVCNFIVFCEVLVSHAPNLNKIVLRTRALRPEIRCCSFVDLKNSLLARNIQLEIQRSDTIHDREIRFNNGWTYRIGRGLDYFQKQQGYTLGLTNYNFRRCLETSVCITKELR